MPGSKSMTNGENPSPGQVSEVSSFEVGNFADLCREIDGQMAEQSRAYDSLDSKIGILLGFTMLALAGVAVSGDLLNKVLASDWIAVVIFTIGVVCLALSLIAGASAYYSNFFSTGVEVMELEERFRNRSQEDFNAIAYRSLFDATLANQAALGNKSEGVVFLLITQIVGILLILLSSILAYGV